MKVLLALLLALPLAAETLTFKVVGIDCSACAAPVTRALEGVPGVESVKVNAKAKSATVEVPQGFDRQHIRTALSNAGFAAVFPGEAERDIEPLPAGITRKLDIQTFTNGHRVDLAKILAPGKVTIVDFYADWCGPCHILEARIERLMNGSKPNLALRRVNIGKWDNDAAKQATELKASALPYIRVYDAKGKFVTDVTGGMWDEVLDAIQGAER